MSSKIEPILEARSVSKSFGPVRALEDATLKLRPGEIRAVMGENGAGKSTLIRILSGALRPDAGTVALLGQAVSIGSPAQAQSLGISTVFQELTLSPTLSVAEGVCLGREPRRLGWIDSREMKRRARAALERVGVVADLDSPLGLCPAATRQLVAIARALEGDSKALILDEPTSSLDRAEAGRLFDLMFELRSRGMAILFVTHFLDQAYAVADSFSVLQGGRLVGTWSTAELPRSELVRLMVGRDLEPPPSSQSESRPEAEPILSAREVTKRRFLERFDLHVSPGEIVGLAGLLGSGRTEAMRILAGDVRPDQGALEWQGKRHPCTIRGAMGAGIAFLPEDRKVEGLFPGLTVAENIVLALQVRRGWWRRIGKRQKSELAREFIERLAIRCAGPDATIESLSGGNQQKAILSRWLAVEPRAFLMDDPTRGVDIGSKFEIRQGIREHAARGAAIVFTSSELEEIVQACDRVAVLRDRRSAGELHGSEVNESNILARIAEEAPS